MNFQNWLMGQSRPLRQLIEDKRSQINRNYQSLLERPENQAIVEGMDPKLVRQQVITLACAKASYAVKFRAAKASRAISEQVNPETLRQAVQNMAY